MGDARDLLDKAGWTRRGPFWSPPGSQAKYTLAGATAQLGSSTLQGRWPDKTWKRGDIVEWLQASGTTYDPDATKAVLLETVAELR